MEKINMVDLQKRKLKNFYIIVYVITKKLSEEEKIDNHMYNFSFVSPNNNIQIKKKKVKSNSNWNFF